MANKQQPSSFHHGWELSLVDALLIVSAFSAGYGVSRGVGNIYDTLYAGFFCGSFLAIVLLLSFQFTAQRRRQWPSGGECLWLLPGAMYLAMLFATIFLRWLAFGDEMVLRVILVGGVFTLLAELLG